YGHPDHVKAHQVAVAAFKRSGVARPARLYFVRFPLGWSREFVRALREAGIDAPGSAPAGADAGPDVAEIGTEDALVTTRIDVRQYVATKRAALACHQSQMSADHFLMRMPDPLAQRLWAYEFFSREDGAALEYPSGAESAARRGCSAGGAESLATRRSDSADALAWLERREGLESDLFAGLT